MKKTCLCKVWFTLKASEKHVSWFLDDSLGKCVSTGSSSYFTPPTPTNQYPALSKLIFLTKPIISLWFIFLVLFWVLRGDFERAACLRQKYFLRVWGSCSVVWRKPRLPTDFNFIFNVHGNQSYMPGWIQNLDFWQVLIWAQLGWFSKCPDCSH